MQGFGPSAFAETPRLIKKEIHRDSVQDLLEAGLGQEEW